MDPSSALGHSSSHLAGRSCAPVWCDPCNNYNTSVHPVNCAVCATCNDFSQLVIQSGSQLMWSFMVCMLCFVSGFNHLQQLIRCFYDAAAVDAQQRHTCTELRGSRDSDSLIGKVLFFGEMFESSCCVNIILFFFKVNLELLLSNQSNKYPKLSVRVRGLKLARRSVFVSIW